MKAWLADFLQGCMDFPGILNASITASWVVLAVLILRGILRKAPKWTHVALWGLVALRLLLPFPIESVFSLIPSTETLPHEILTYGPVRHAEPARLDIVTNPVFSQPVSVELPQTVDRVQGFEMNMTLVWWAGIAVMVLYTLVSYWRLRRRVAEAVRLRRNIYRSERIASPFVLGVLRPRIYLPFGMSEQDMGHVIAHEQAHIRRKDHWWKPLGFLLLTFHWFNPLMWLAYILLCRDIELACDEKVVKALGREARADYSQALLKCSVSHRSIAACPLAFGEVGVKDRVKNVLNYKKPAFWIVLAAVIACVVGAVCFLTNPVTKRTPTPILQELKAEDVEWAQVTIWDSNNEHILLDDEQITGLITILNSLEKHDFLEQPTESHKLSLMLFCGSREILLQSDGNSVTFIFDTETAKTVDDISWTVKHDPLIKFLCSVYPALNSPKLLSLNDVLSLSQKGGSLTWADFESYVSEEVGSGLYILRYEIDDVFHVLVGGVPDETPWYIRLCTNSTEEYIDLTTDDPLPFIRHYSADFSADALSALWDEDTYTVTDQEQAEIALSIRSTVLTDACYTEAGQDFEPGQVTAYQDGNTRIWLSRVQQSNESGDQLYFTFRLAYAIGSNGSVLSVNRRSTDGSYTNAVSISSHVLKTGWDAYPNAVSLRGEGPGEQFTLYVSADACRAIEGRMAFQVELNKISYQRKLSAPETASDALEEAISAAILDHFDTDPQDGLIHVESHIVLDTEEKRSSPFLFWQEQRVTETTVYLLVLHESYRTDSGELAQYGGSCGPTAITFKAEPDGSYTLEEYWEPRDGSLYSSDIKRKFPGEVADILWEYDGTYSSRLEEENLLKAQEYIAQYGTTYTTVEYLLKQILPYDTTAKNPQLWLDESPEEYRRLLDLGTGTLYYCFSRFLEGGQTDMRGHIMALLCQQIMAQWDESYDLKGGGQDWFDAFRWSAEALAMDSDLETIRMHHPGAYLLLEMSAKIIPTPTTFAFGNGTDLLNTASVTLREDGTFWFNFSPISSYIGHGDYTIENGRLILPTDDGRFTYYFDILDENTLAFDAEASSEMTWFAELSDGALFSKTVQSSTDIPMTALEDLPESYNGEQAQIDGCLLMKDNWVLSGTDAWERFLSDTSRGQPGFVRVFREYTEREGSGYEKEIYDLHYNGSVYTLKIKDGTTVKTEEYAYLRYFYGEVTDGSVDYDAIERYVLTNDMEASWEEIWPSAASSRYGDLIPHYVVYSDLFCFTDHPNIPELSSAALEMDGRTLVSVTDPDSVNRLEALLSGAEGLGYEPKTYNLGVTLELTTVSGEVLTLELNILSDLMVVGQAFYDYGPGYTDVGAYDGLKDLLAIFGLTHWPDAVYETYADWLGPIPTGEPETEPVDQFPGGSILVWYPDLTCEELDYKHPVSTLLEAFAAMELEPTNQPQPELAEAEYTLHIAYNNGEEFDLVYAGNGQFFYRIFKTQQTYTFTSYDLHEVIQTALDGAS